MKNDLFNDRISRFSIRKLNVGVCSVLLGTLVMLGTATGVAAEEVAENKQTDEVAVTTEKEQPESLSTSQAEKEDATTYQANPVVPVATETKLELDQTRLQAYIAEIETNLTNGKYSNKTDESVEILKVALANAKNALTSATSQAELDTAYQSLATIVNDKLKEKEVPTKPTAAEEKIAAGAEAPASEDAPKRRSRRAVGDPNDESLIGDDVEDATSTPKVEKPTGWSSIDAKELVKQVNWLDFGDTAAWSNTTTSKDGRTALQVGSTFTKEIMPGYVINIKVKSLKPFQATELYKKRMEKQGATEEEKATYDPNAKNGYIGTISDPKTRAAFANNEEALVVADAQNGWTEIRKEGINTGTKRTTISSDYNGGNIGIQFEISATFRGKKVKPAVVAADGESANPGELVMFTTNGVGWEYVGEWKKNTNSVNYAVQDTKDYFDPANGYGRTKPISVEGTNITGLNLQLLRDAKEVGPDKKPVAWKYFGNPDQVTGGLGTGIFGPNVSASNFSVPIVMTRSASEIGLYIASSGKQSAMLGFFPLDEGDAPESYGKAIHSIGTVDGVTGAKLSQPYLGNVSPDMDENTPLDWFGDDNTTTADEGINQLLPEELKGTTNEMIKMDRTKPGNYKMSVQAHLDGAKEAYIYGWVDFNQNGTFDEDERSNLSKVTQDGTVELTFANSKTYIDPSVNELGARVRIAKKDTEIESPTGMALSGEVEDFKTQITHPPKGEFKETTGLQGAKQTATVAFTARGEQKYIRNSTAVIDESVEPYIVDKDGNRATLDAEGYYVVPGQGKYKITANGKDVNVEFIPEDNFLGTADGISIRRTDSNGYDTGWSTKFPADEANVDTVLNTMDGLYIPTVTPIEIEGLDKTSTDVQGASQIATPEFALEGTNSNGEKVKITPDFDYPAKFVSPTTGKVINDPVVTVEGEGIYYLDDLTGKVTFVPEPGFTGTAKGVTVSLTAPVGRDKNKQVQSEFIKTATAKYIPTVTPVTIAPTNKVSEDVQNVPQTQTPTFELSNDKATKITSKKLVDPATGQSTDETSVTVAGEGSYTIDPTTGAVTFSPEKDFVGTATGVTVQATATITNANGKTSTITSDATYTPTVVAAVPTASPATSKDIQGATQTGRPTFTEGDSRVPMNDDVPATFDDGSTTKTVDGVGTYTVVADGTVTFVPEPSFTGTAPAVTVVREDKNGTKASATYTPTVTPVTPTASPATSKDIQGATQTGKPVFTEGDSRVPMNDAVPATFDDGSTSKTVDGVGTYTVAADGTVTFVPEPSFTGTAPAVTVVREDKNGTKASANYTPTVNPVTLTPTNKVSEDIQNVPQTETSTFALSDDETAQITSKKLVDPATGQPTDETSVTVASEGTYTIDPTTGAVTFTPEKDFVGTATGVTVQATATITNANGKISTITSDATYTPTVVAAVPTASPATSKDIQGATQTGRPTFAGTTVQVNGKDKAITIKENSYTLLNKDGNEVATMPAYAADGTTEIGTFTINPATGQVTFTPTDKSYTGAVTPAKVQAESSNGIKVDTIYTPEIVPVTPTATPAETTDIQGATQTGKPEFKGGTVTVDGVEKTVAINEDVPATFDDGSTTKTVDGVGTYTVAADGTVTFVPEKSFTGKAPSVTVVREDKNGTKASATYTPTVTPVTPTAEDATSTDKQGQKQSGKPTFTPGNENVPMDDDTPATFEDGSTTQTIPGEGTYTVAPDGTVTFVPEKSFTGEGTGVTVKRVDKNGTPVTAKYTPTVTPVTPTATPVETTDIQGATQTGKPKFTEGDPVVPMDDDTPATFEDGSTTKTIPGEGTYTVDPDGTVTFVPEKSFTGTGTGVTVKRVDKNGMPATAKYTPTVTPVTPTAAPAESTDIQGATQTGKPEFTAGNSRVSMNDDVAATFDDGSTSKTVDGVGTYTVAADGTVTFVPEKAFVGTAPAVTVVREDKNGTKASATYTPTVTPVTPTAEPATSTDIQGQTQTGKPTFTEGNPNVPIDEDTPATFEDGSTTKTVDGEGTYTVSPDGTVTFVPEKSFTGEGSGVTVRRVDKNGTEITAKYTPTVTPVTPTAEDTTSTGKQGQTQTGKPKFTEGDSRVPMNDDVPATFEDGSTTKTVDGEGTYTVAPDGTVTFVPEKSFTGTGTGVTVKRVDKNGTPATAKYTPTVTPVTPTAEPATSTDIQGQTQTGKPTFTPGNPDVSMDDDTPATFEDGSTTKVIPGEGTYTVAPDGTVTFVPEKSFTGTGTGVTVKRVDKNGTPATAKYTPTVTPVTPTATPATTIGSKGQEQSGKPAFKEGDSRVPMNDNVPATFEDGSTTKTIPGVGTYTVAADGTVTFKPEPEFTGTAPSVTVVREDVNGTKASATYTPTVTPVTTFVDKAGNSIPGYPSEDGEQPKKEIPGYRFVETKKLPNGDTEHVYEPVTTSFKDKEGNSIPGYPSEDGEQPKKAIPGYRFVETKKLPNGDTEHVYEKITTSYVDENGNPIPGYPTENGEQPKKEIPGYEFVKTVVDKDGNIQHIYKKVVTPNPVPTPDSKPTPDPVPTPEPKPIQAPETPSKSSSVTETGTKTTTPQLPNTGTKDHAGLAALGLVGILSGFGLMARKKKED